MEPTPELKTFARELIGPDATEQAHAILVHALMSRAKELRAVLEPFERAAEFPPHIKEAVEHARMMRESTRAADEATLNNVLANKPMPVFREPLWPLWARIKRPLLGALADGLAGLLMYVVVVDVLDGPIALGWVFAAAGGFASGFLRRML